MAFKPNYNQQRAERNRAKQAKKDEKQREREEEVARRKAGLPPLESAAPDGVAEAEDVELNEGGHDGTAAA
jgi:CRISPR/Cas system-associated protein Cas10 (large subunit of type III CRISPR-Cas system)